MDVEGEETTNVAESPDDQDRGLLGHGDGFDVGAVG